MALRAGCPHVTFGLVLDFQRRGEVPETESVPPLIHFVSFGHWTRRLAFAHSTRAVSQIDFNLATVPGVGRFTDLFVG